MYALFYLDKLDGKEVIIKTDTLYILKSLGIYFFKILNAILGHLLLYSQLPI